MKQIFSILVMLLCILSYSISYSQIIKLPADSLVANIEHYDGKLIETEGLVVHVCGVDGKKLKLKTDGGEIIKVVPFDSLERFDDSLSGKRVKVVGIVKEFRVERNEIDSLAKTKTLLCHIDNSPCIDSVWVRNMKESGKADAQSEKSVNKLNGKMNDTGKDYISVVTIFAKKIEIVGIDN